MSRSRVEKKNSIGNEDCGFRQNVDLRRDSEVKISVIMGLYNPKNREHLLQALLSVIHQTMSDWELILCDDGSDKKGAEMICEAAELDPRIVLIRNQNNHGLGYSLNKCIHIAQGKYIARMDGDDISMPERFQKQYDFLESNRQYQWTGSNAALFDESGIWGVDRMPEIPQARDFLPYSPYIHPSVMFQKEILQETGGYSAAELTRRCEDYELFMRLHKAGYQGYNMQESLIQYREDGNTYKKRTIQSRIREMQVRYRGFKQLGILHSDTAAYVVRPLAAGALSPIVLEYLRKNVRVNHRGIYREQQM